MMMIGNQLEYNCEILKILRATIRMQKLRSFDLDYELYKIHNQMGAISIQFVGINDKYQIYE